MLRSPKILIVLETTTRAVYEQFPPGYDVSACESADLLDRITEAEAIVVSLTPVGQRELDRAPRLRFIQKFSAGFDGVDLPAAARRGIVVANTAGCNGISVAEHAFLLILAVARKLGPAYAALRDGHWKSPGATCVELNGKTLGIVGYGFSGRSLAKKGLGFEMRVITTTRRPQTVVDPGVTAVDLDALLRESDVVSLNCPLTPETNGLIGARELELMKPTAILVNVARGAVVDEPALLAALQSGRILGAGLDVFAEEPTPADNPLLHLDNVVVSPHYAGGSVESRIRSRNAVFENLRRFCAGEPVRNAASVTT